MALLATFALVAWASVSGKSATYDEPLHAVGAWLHWHEGDFRINPEDPPLWHYWAALPNGRDALVVDLDSVAYRMATEEHARQWGFVAGTLYFTPQNTDSDGFLLRSRTMMLIVGIGLGALIAWWSWRIGGAVAAIAATLLFAFDPNMLAHAPLVKNDVAFALIILAVAYAVWRAGQRVTVLNVLLVGLLCGAGLSVKFSGVLLGPIVAMLLIGRAMLPTPWLVARLGEVTTRPRRAMLAMSVCIIALVLSVIVVWASYGFRFAPTSDPASRLDMAAMVDALQHRWASAEFDTPEPTPDQLAQWRPPMLLRAVRVLHDRELLPQAWLHGFLYTYQSAVSRRSYLLGETSLTGWWYYFPLAMAFKAPLALLASCVGAIEILVWAGRRDQSPLRRHAWVALCLIVPPGMYMLSAMTSNLNIGIRHVLPVFPFLFIGIGLSASSLWQHRPRLARPIGWALAGVLVVETLLSFPHYIAFFNAPSAPFRLSLLGDSNLDWGQDLKLLADWHRAHRDRPLYLAYFGQAAPGYYGIEYVNMPNAYYFGPDPIDVTSLEQLPRRGVLAVSATMLQGQYLDERYRPLYQQIRDELEPFDVIGRTIYLYDLAQLGSK